MKIYIEALIAHDFDDVAYIRQRDVMRDLVSILAAWSSKFMDISKIGSGLAIERKTLTSYIRALQSLYLVEAVPAWGKPIMIAWGSKPSCSWQTVG